MLAVSPAIFEKPPVEVDAICQLYDTVAPVGVAIVNALFLSYTSSAYRFANSLASLSDEHP